MKNLIQITTVLFLLIQTIVDLVKQIMTLGLG